jgi:hypothetical protein
LNKTKGVSNGDAKIGQNPLFLSIPTNKVVFGLELLKEMEEHMVKIRHNLKASHDRQKSYAHKNRVFRHFKVGEHVFLK